MKIKIKLKLKLDFPGEVLLYIVESFLNHIKGNVTANLARPEYMFSCSDKHN